MHIVKFTQDEKTIEIGIFDTLENALVFLKSIPGFYIENDGIFTYYYLKNEDIDFEYINYKDKLFPYSKYSFNQNMKIEIFIYEIPYFDDNKKGIINSSTLIDAYMINNDEVEKYINLREKKYNNLKKILEKKT